MRLRHGEETPSTGAILGLNKEMVCFHRDSDGAWTCLQVDDSVTVDAEYPDIPWTIPGSIDFLLDIIRPGRRGPRELPRDDLNPDEGVLIIPPNPEPPVEPDCTETGNCEDPEDDGKKPETGKVSVPGRPVCQSGVSGFVSRWNSHYTSSMNAAAGYISGGAKAAEVGQGAMHARTALAEEWATSFSRRRLVAGVVGEFAGSIALGTLGVMIVLPPSMGLGSLAPAARDMYWCNEP